MICPKCFFDTDDLHECLSCGNVFSDDLFDGNKALLNAKKLISNKKIKGSQQWLRIASSLKNADAMFEFGKLYLVDFFCLGNQNLNIKNAVYCFENALRLKHVPTATYLIENEKTYNFQKLFSNEQWNEVLSLAIINLNEDDLEEETEYFKEDEAKGFIYQDDGDMVVVPFKIVETQEDLIGEEQMRLEEFYNQVMPTINELEESLEDYNEYEVIQTSDYKDLGDVQLKKDIFRHKLEELNSIKSILDNPYYFRMKVKYNDGEIKDIYIGPKAIGENVYSWFSELGNKVYDNVNFSWKIKNYNVKLLNKRSITIESRNVVKVSENYDVQKGYLISDDYLLTVLKKRKHNSEITPIIESIQHHQNQIIISDNKKNMVMQGSAGCGKTMILYHRLKYLIANKILNGKRVCAITPSASFNRHFRPLIEKLEIENVNNYSIVEYYVNSILNGYHGQWRMSYNLNEIELRNKQGFTTILTIKDDRDLPKEVVDYYYSEEFFEKINNLPAVKIYPLLKERYTRYKDSLGRVDILKVLFQKKVLSLFPVYEREYGVIHKCELFAICFLYYKRCGKQTFVEHSKDSDSKKIEFIKPYNFIFIDEAQDLSLSEYKLINSISNKPIFNLFGDVDQMIYKYGIKKWDILTSIIGNFDYYELNTNYRNTSEIIHYVNEKCNTKMDDVGYSSYDVKEIDIDECRNILNFSGERYPVLCKEKYKNHLYLRLRHYGNFDIYSISEIKGLEFKTVFVYDKELTNNEKYIAYTRALDRLIVIK